MELTMFKRFSVALVVAVGLALSAGTPRHEVFAQSSALSCGIDMKVLVISADGNEAALPAITDALGYAGVPFEKYIATQAPGGLTADRLANGCRGFYQGVILTTGNLAYADGNGNFVSALTTDEFSALASYESAFGVRQATWFTYPSPDLGFNWPTWPGGAADTTSAPLHANLTVAGGSVFNYLRSGADAAPIQIKNAYTYLSTPLDDTSTPLIEDANGNALALIKTFEDGRSNLAMTFDSNPYLTHSILVSYGVVNWVTGGQFIGDRRVMVSPQVDDVFIHDERWLVSTPCGTSVDNTGAQHRMTGADYNAIANWQAARRLNPQFANLRLTMAFNGVGTTGSYLTVGGGDALTNPTTVVSADSLTSAAQRRQGVFNWVSHTYEHPNLDHIDYGSALNQLTLNNSVATTLGLNRYSVTSLVQPEVSGLYNPEFLRAAKDAGVRYLVSDTSKPDQRNPRPNIGYFSALQPEIFVIPRHANNLFFNVVTPAEWVAEYNCIYNGFWGRDLSYAEILDNQSDLLVTNMFRGDLDPWMFHEANLGIHDGSRSLLSDLLDATFAKYSRHMNLPILSPNQHVLGERMANKTRIAMNNVQGRVDPGKGFWLTSPVAVKVPLTGVAKSGSENYGGQSTLWVNVPANTPTFVAWPNTIGTKPPKASAGLAQTVNWSSTVTLNGSGVDSNDPPKALTYSWVQTSGPAVTIQNADAAVATFVAPALAAGSANATLRFTLTVSNGVFSTPAVVKVTVLAPKAVRSLSAKALPSIAYAGTTVSLTATALDVNVPVLPLTFTWTQISGPAVTLTNADRATATFVAPRVLLSTTATFRVTVSNGVSTATTTTSVSIRR